MTASEVAVHLSMSLSDALSATARASAHTYYSAPESTPVLTAAASSLPLSYAPYPPTSVSPSQSLSSPPGSSTSSSSLGSAAMSTSPTPSSAAVGSVSSVPANPSVTSVPAAAAAPAASGTASTATSTASPAPTSTAAAVNLAPSGAVLDSLLARRALLEDDLRSVERQLVELEESYMEDTAAYGNVVKGWEGFLSSKMSHKHSAAANSVASLHQVGSGGGLLTHGAAAAALGGSGGGGDAIRRSRLPLRDRLFSSSSSTAPLRAGSGVSAGNGFSGLSAAGGPSSSSSSSSPFSLSSSGVSGGVGSFSLSSGELDLSGGLVGFDSSLPHSQYASSQSAASAGSGNQSYSSSGRRSTGRRTGTGLGVGMDVEDGSG